MIHIEWELEMRLSS